MTTPRDKAKSYPKPTLHMAFSVWKENGRPSFRLLAALLKQEGFAISHNSLKEWANKDVEWKQLLLDAKAPPPEELIDALKNAKDDASELVSEHFQGVKARLVARLYLSIQKIEINTIENWKEALGCCEQLEGLIHSERGKRVLNPSDKADGGVSSLMERMSPVVNIAPFKKPVAAGGTK